MFRRQDELGLVVDDMLVGLCETSLLYAFDSSDKHLYRL